MWTIEIGNISANKFCYLLSKQHFECFNGFFLVFEHIISKNFSFGLWWGLPVMTKCTFIYENLDTKIGYALYVLKDMK